MAADGLVWRFAGLRPRRARPRDRRIAIDRYALLALVRHFKDPTGGPGGPASRPDDHASSLDQPVTDADELVSDLTRRFWNRLRFFAARRLRQPGDAEDVAQEVLRRTLEALRGGRVEDPNALPAFVFQTARNICLQKARSAGREEKAYTRFASQADGSAGHDPTLDLISRERRQILAAALWKMDARERDLLRLCFVDGLDSKRIAFRLRISPAAVRVRKHRALERLTEIVRVTTTKERELS